jgi:hypothetical protein
MALISGIMVIGLTGGIVALAFKAFGIDSKKINSYFEN